MVSINATDDRGTSSSKATLIVYGDDMSQPSRAVFLFCREANIPFTKKLTLIHKGQQRSPEFLALNPRGKIPVIDDGGFVLTESSAILRYLADTRLPADNHWLPRNDAKRRALIDSWLDWRDTNLRHGAARTAMIDGGLMEKLQVHWSDATKAVLGKEARNALTNSLTIIEKQLAQPNHPFVVGEKMTLVDLSFAEEIAMLGLVPSFSLDKWPHVKEWMARVQSHCQHWESVNATLQRAITARRASLNTSAATSKL